MGMCLSATTAFTADTVLLWDCVTSRVNTYTFLKSCINAINATHGMPHWGHDVCASVAWCVTVRSV